MAKQMLGPKKLRKYSKMAGRTFDVGYVRGGWEHTVLLRDTTSAWWCYDPKDNEFEKRDDIYTGSNNEGYCYKECA